MSISIDDNGEQCQPRINEPCLFIRGDSSNSHNLILKWYPRNWTAVWGLLIQGWHYWPFVRHHIGFPAPKGRCLQGLCRNSCWLSWPVSWPWKNTAADSPTGWGPVAPKIAFSCVISVAEKNYGKNGRYNELVHGGYFMVYQQTYNWGGPILYPILKQANLVRKEAAVQSVQSP